MSISVISYFNGKNQIACEFTVDSDASEKQILALAKKAISNQTDLPADLLTLQYTAGYVHILDRHVPPTHTQVDAEIQRCRLRRQKSGEWLQRAIDETQAKAKENKTRQSTT